MKRRRRKRKPEATISCEIDELGPREERDGNTYMYEDIVFDAEIFQESTGYEPNWIEARSGHATCYRVQLNEKGEEVMRMLLTNELIDKYAPLEAMARYAEEEYTHG